MDKFRVKFTREKNHVTMEVLDKISSQQLNLRVIGKRRFSNQMYASDKATLFYTPHPAWMIPHNSGYLHSIWIPLAGYDKDPNYLTHSCWFESVDLAKGYITAICELIKEINEVKPWEDKETVIAE